MSDNQVSLTGNLTDDPELRFTPNGVAVANFRLAVDQRVWDADGWKHISRSLHKGARCVVVGRLRSRSWETPEGQRRSSVEVDAEEVGMSMRFAPVGPPPAEAAEAKPAPAKNGGNGSRRGRQPAKAAAGRDEAPF
jgi:single-strand DNA-binding protein